MTKKPKVQAHRGYSGLYPENTLIAFEKAMEVGAVQLELDIHISADDIVFVIHDATLDRTTNGSGPIRSLSSQKLKELDAGSWFDARFSGERIPTLVEVFELVQGRASVNIEIKSFHEKEEDWRQAVSKAMNDIAMFEMWENALFSSFDHRALRLAKQLEARARTAFLDFGGKTSPSWLCEANIDGWIPYKAELTRKQVLDAQERGLFVIMGAGNDPSARIESVRNALHLGVDVISSNYPKEVVAILAKEIS